MKKTITETLEIPVLGEYDVIVCGGGIGGVAAAVAAVRAGASVLLLEKSIQLGGLATSGLISWYEPICDGYGKKIMYGMTDELLQLAVEYSADSLDKGWCGNPDAAENVKKRFATFYSPTIMSLVLDRWVSKEKLDLLFDTLVVSVKMKGGNCEGIVVENKGGRGIYMGKMIIDATGDADILYKAGVPCVNGSNYLTYIAYETDLNNCEAAIEKGDILKSRKWVNVGADLWGNGHPKDMPLFTELSAEEITRFVLEGRKLYFERIKEKDRWERDITILPSMPQFRTTRRLVGAYTLEENDQGRSFADSIGIAGDFAKRGHIYELPYRLLYHSEYNNLLTVGRSISSSGWAWEVTRVIPVAALTGQAAGTAAALCTQKGVSVFSLDITELQRELQKTGVRIHIDQK